MAVDYFETLARLKHIYAQRGIEISVGVNSYLCSNVRSAPFALYHRDGELLTIHSGTGYDELLLIGRVASIIEAKRILIIGNGLGWSTLGLALLCPKARVIALEPQAGIDLTNSLALEHGLNAEVIQGRSPQDNDRAIRDELGGIPDLILIDALHDEASVAADFTSLYGVCGSRPVYVFHDVLTFGLTEMLHRLGGAAPSMEPRIANATSSGLGFLVPAALLAITMPTISLFQLSPSATATLRRIGSERAMPPVDLLR